MLHKLDRTSIKETRELGPNQYSIKDIVHLYKLIQQDCGQLASAIEQQQNATISVCVTLHSNTKVIIIQQDLHWCPANNYHHTSSQTIDVVQKGA